MLRQILTKKLFLGFLVSVLMLSAFGINYAVGVDGPEVKTISLEEATELAMQNNPDMEIESLAVEKAQIEHDGAKATAKTHEKKEKRDREHYYLTYEVGLLRWFNPKAKEVALVLAEKRQDVNEKKLKLDVEKAYYDVLKAEKGLEIERAGLKYFQDQLKIAQTAFKVGTKAKLDVTTAEAAVAGYQAAVTRAENTYRTSVLDLNRIIGLDLDTPLKLTSKFAVEKAGDSINLQETITQALEDNMGILSARKTLELNQVKSDVTKKFYNQGVTVYETAEIDKKSAEASVRKEEVDTTASVRKSYLTLFSLEKMIDWQTKEVEKARENARVFMLKYEAGLATALDARNAAIDLETAEQNLTNTIYDYNLTKSQFKYQLFTP
ncbi:TolC family protein [Phosphitispora fastidiosa]|uniref:TolC family protein n=1 Tax=Phosphitispora fastidiosa TaxID=2837202 RepID=UPI001E2C13BF|nr:TolC family protein [Phosphitispora fastidiosa]MBU7008206.1 outer membrane protein TolC [Phosphitispora fastidiosa]